VQESASQERHSQTSSSEHLDKGVHANVEETQDLQVAMQGKENESEEKNPGKTNEVTESFVLNISNSYIHDDLLPIQNLNCHRPATTPTPQKRSQRLKESNRADKPVSLLAQEVLAKKLGYLEEDQKINQEAIKKFQDSFKQPLAQDVMDKAERAIQERTPKRVKKATKEVALSK